MKKIILEGILGDKFGREWNLDVRTPSEAMRAIDANKKGFIRYIADSGNHGVGYQVIIGSREIIEENVIDEFHFPFSNKEELILVPVISGSAGGSQGPIKFLIGAIILTTAIILAAPTGGGSLVWGTQAIGFLTAGNLAMVGVMLMASGISMMLAADPKSEKSKDDASYLFNGPVNTIAQGGPVPVGYGRLLVGSVLISGGIVVDEYPLSVE